MLGYNDTSLKEVKTHLYLLNDCQFVCSETETRGPENTCLHYLMPHVSKRNLKVRITVFGWTRCIREIPLWLTINQCPRSESGLVYVLVVSTPRSLPHSEYPWCVDWQDGRRTPGDISTPWCTVGGWLCFSSYLNILSDGFCSHHTWFCRKTNCVVKKTHCFFVPTFTQTTLLPL